MYEEDHPVLSSVENVALWTPDRGFCIRTSAVVIEGVEALERITDERQTQLRSLMSGLVAGLRSHSGCIVGLINLISWEIRCVDIG